MKTLTGKVAAITGAASGIGRATAVLLASRGCAVAISDVDERGLEETQSLCEAHGVTVTRTKVDVANREQVYAWAEAVVKAHGQVNIIINNAGVALGATVETMSYQDFEWLMGINFWGVVYGTKAFLPHLKASGDGAIVNVSSVFGLIGVPTQSAYNSAKFAVKGFTECLREELGIERAKVSVTCVHPGGIKTNIAKNARMVKAEGLINDQSKTEFEKAFRTTADQAAKQIVNAMMKRSPRVLVGFDAVAVDVMQRLLPTSYQNLIIAGGRRRMKQMKSS